MESWNWDKTKMSFSYMVSYAIPSISIILIACSLSKKKLRFAGILGIALKIAESYWELSRFFIVDKDISINASIHSGNMYSSMYSGFTIDSTKASFTSVIAPVLCIIAYGMILWTMVDSLHNSGRRMGKVLWLLPAILIGVATIIPIVSTKHYFEGFLANLRTALFRSSNLELSALEILLAAHLMRYLMHLGMEKQQESQEKAASPVIFSTIF